jgi:hypothetical protein
MLRVQVLLSSVRGASALRRSFFGTGGRGRLAGRSVRSAGAIALVFLMVLPGCYTTRPVYAGMPQPGMNVSLQISDEGRVALRDRVGPSVARVEGVLVRAPDTSYVLTVNDVIGIYGERTRWSGEQVGIRREYVGMVYERRFSPARTALFVGGVGALGYLLFGRALPGIFGGDSDGVDRPPDPPAQ